MGSKRSYVAHQTKELRTKVLKLEAELKHDDAKWKKENKAKKDQMNEDQVKKG